MTSPFRIGDQLRIDWHGSETSLLTHVSASRDDSRPDDLWVALGDQHVQLWDADTGSLSALFASADLITRTGP